MTTVTRCPWVGKNKPHYEAYHDQEWGKPVYDDQHLFEMLILEGAQAGLSWETILKRRTAYREVFLDLVPHKVAVMSDETLEGLCQDSRIIRNRLKIFSVRKNARVFCAIQEEKGSFADYVWGFVNHRPIINRPRCLADVPAVSPQSEALSRDLKKRGMSFVGPTIMYAYMQAVGLVNDHLVDCSFAPPE
ncbi:MAG: DNA-3-methyladenine glycosylase I [Legionellaceae bacterium]|nr:DNA-3-methyladenine glycosylase I [Legionellaceae bacterium]